MVDFSVIPKQYQITKTRTVNFQKINLCSNKLFQYLTNVSNIFLSVFETTFKQFVKYEQITTKEF